MICASRSSVADRLLESLPSATGKEIPEFSEAEVRIVVERLGSQFVRDEKLLELITNPLYLYLWLETGAGPPYMNLWVEYWDKIIHGTLAVQPDWETLSESEFRAAKMDVLDWLAQRMFQEGTYQVPFQQTGELLAEHTRSVAYEALIRADVLLTTRSPGTTAVQFFHQAFFEFCVARRILGLPRQEPRHAIDQLIGRVDEPFCRQIIDDVAYLARETRPDLEDYLYQGLIDMLGSSKMLLLQAQREECPAPPSASAVSWGIDYVLQDLVDLWGTRMCATLDSGSSDCREDGEVVSTIGSVFERNPRPFAVPSLIASMRKYDKRGRFIGALGEIRTEEAQAALLEFTQEQIACPTDEFVFRFLATAVGEACGEDGVPLLCAIRDGDFDAITKHSARRALRKLGQEEESGATLGYQLEHILAALRLEDEEGRPSDWRLVAKMATWLRRCGAENQLVQAHLGSIVSALEAGLNHMHDGAREPVAEALGELGGTQTFDLVSKRLAEGIEPSQRVVTEMLSALVRLRERGLVNPAMTLPAVQERFSRIRLQYPAQAEKIQAEERKIVEHLRKES
jgi:hypothetical protein